MNWNDLGNAVQQTKSKINTENIKGPFGPLIMVENLNPDNTDKESAQ